MTRFREFPRCALLIGTLMLCACASFSDDGARSQSSGEGSDAALTLHKILWDGREVLLRLDPSKLAAHRLSHNELAIPMRMREGEYFAEIWKDGRRPKEGEDEPEKVDLADLCSSIEIRPLHVPPFEVELEDGRVVRVTPRPERVREYLVPGQYFENNVRSMLRYRPADDLAKTVVLDRLPVPGGQVPNMWDENHVHWSLGEPLDTFADVRVTGGASDDTPAEPDS